MTGGDIDILRAHEELGEIIARGESDFVLTLMLTLTWT